MRSVVLHALLVLSLVFNVVASPWAMANMAHGDHAVASVAGADTAQMHAHASVHAMHASDSDSSTAPHAQHHDHAMHVIPGHDTLPADLTHDDCCGGGLCQCGCIVPPALAAPVMLPLPMPPIAHIALTSVPSKIDGRASPPFRPPAA